MIDISDLVCFFILFLLAGWPQTLKTWKTWKTQRLNKIAKISGTTHQENLKFCRKTWKTQGKCEIFDIITNKNVMQ